MQALSRRFLLYFAGFVCWMQATCMLGGYFYVFKGTSLHLRSDTLLILNVRVEKVRKRIKNFQNTRKLCKFQIAVNQQPKSELPWLQWQVTNLSNLWNAFADINDCSDSPCENGGNCTDGLNTYNCSCVAGYTGKNCTTGKQKALLSSDASSSKMDSAIHRIYHYPVDQLDIEDITWPRGDTKFLFEWWITFHSFAALTREILYKTRREILYL